MKLTLEQSRTRVWIILAMDACDRAGLLPISKTRIHRLLFLANTLAELFEAQPPAKRVLKNDHGPYYPDAQWAIDRLVAMGLVNARNVQLTASSTGAWLSAEYTIAAAGIETAQGIRATFHGSEVGRFIDELVFAFALLRGETLDEVALRELNYALAGVADGVLITFEDFTENRALQKTAEFRAALPKDIPLLLRERIQLYLKYINWEHEPESRSAVV